MLHQSAICEIIYSPRPRDERIVLLRDFFTHHDIRIFSDFDDTIAEE